MINNTISGFYVSNNIFNVFGLLKLNTTLFNKIIVVNNFISSTLTNLSGHCAYCPDIADFFLLCPLHILCIIYVKIRTDIVD